MGDEMIRLLQERKFHHPSIPSSPVNNTATPHSSLTEVCVCVFIYQDLIIESKNLCYCHFKTLENPAPVCRSVEAFDVFSDMHIMWSRKLWRDSAKRPVVVCLPGQFHVLQCMHICWLYLLWFYLQHFWIAG